MKSLRLFSLIVVLMLLAPAAWAQTPFGNAIVLNGTNQYIVVTNFGAIIPTNEITVEFWANTAVATGQSAFILNPDSGGNRLNAHLNYGTFPPQGVIYWDFGNISGGGRVGPVDAPANSISNWVHYAFVASKSGNYMSIYTNGVLLATQTGITPFVRGTYDLDIGGGSNFFSYHGSLDDFRVWNTALSQSQIQANLSTPLTGSETNLVVYYRFDNTGGTVATNSATATGSLYNGAIMGSAPTIPSSVLNIVVTNNADDGAGSLRQAVANAQPGTTITFTNTLSGQTITLGSEIAISNNITIDATSLPGGLTISGNDASRIFSVNSGSSLTLDRLTLSDGNSVGVAYDGYGGAIQNSGNLSLTGCTLAGNSAGPEGGAIENVVGTLTLTNCTLFGNSAYYSGAIGNSAGTVSLADCTLSGNSSTGGGGGAIDNYNDGALNLIGCIIAGNTDSSGTAPDLWMENGPLTANNCLIGNGMNSTLVNGANGNKVGTSGSPINPLLAPLGNYGGPTPTMPPLAGSPAIDAGDDSAASQFATDQRGYPRLAGAHVDIGAVEVNPNTIVTTAADNVAGSLRQVIASTTNTDLISFAQNLSGQTILLTNGEIELANSVAIDGSALANGIVINGNNQSRIFQVDSSATVGLNSLTLTNGNGGDNGGGIYNSGTLTISQCTLVGNSANNIVYNYGGGGGIYNEGTLTVSRSTLTGNSANNHYQGGGGGINNHGTLALNECTFTANSATNDYQGGGGGIYILNSAAMNQCTVTANSASLDFQGGGGGIFILDGYLNITNSIVAGNAISSDEEGTDISAELPPEFGGAIFGGANIVLDIFSFGPTSVSPPIASNPLLAALGNYGGQTPTMPPLAGSPAIDAGDDSAASQFTTDQRGHPRLAGAHVDIGAVEVNPNTIVTTAADNVAGSLRQVIVSTTNTGLISFAQTLSGQTIMLTSGQINLTNNLTIDGSALPNGVTISANHQSRIFEVQAGATDSLNSLTLANGYANGSFPADLGGGIFNDTDATLALNDCTLTNNGAIFGAGIENQGTLNIYGCTFSGNVAGSGGSAIDVSENKVTAVNSTFFGNSGPYYGTIFNNYSTVILNNCTLTGNSSVNGEGGGIDNYGSLYLTNTIVSGNTAYTGNNLNNEASIYSAGNLIDGVPHLAALGNYGGKTFTMPPLPGSPAIDAGQPTYLTTDQRGFARPAGGGVDIGAVEVQTASADNPPVLENVVKSGGGSGSGAGNFQFTFTTAPDADFTVLTSTNLALPLANWTVLGEVMQPTPGQYQFTDAQATNKMRFYRVVSP